MFGKRFQAIAVVAVVVAAGWPGAAQAQTAEDVPRVTRTYALVNARVVQAPGRTLERATVIVRDGRIYAVAPDAALPFDAERIAADSLVVYAGFIDGLTHVGIPRPKNDGGDAERPEDPGNPPNDEAGIQPHRDARDLLDASEKSIEQWREAGFTAAHTVPYGRMLPGSGAVILLAEADDPGALVLRGQASLFAQFEPARRMYPGTDMAIMAKMRQLYREAARRQRLEARYAENPAGQERPAYDAVHYAFFPVLDGRTPIFFHTESVLDLHRALDLHRRLGFPLVLTGLNQGFAALDALRDANVPLLLTLDLPEDKKEKKSAPDSLAADVPPADTVHAMTPSAPGSFFLSDQRTRSYEDLDDEREKLEARRTFEHEKYLKTAAWLHEAGLRFGVTTRDLKKPADALANLRTMIAHGLPEDAALAALTTDGAALLGLGASLGTVEPGKIANLVVTDGPLFDEKTKIRYVFVDGQKFEVEAKPEKKTAAEGGLNPAGTWAYTVETPQGTFTGTLRISGTPGDLRGTLESDDDPGNPSDLDDLELDGDLLSFNFDGGEFGRLSVSVTLTDDDFDGTLTVPQVGGVPITGVRTSGPNG